MKNYARARDFDFAETIFIDSYADVMSRPEVSTDIFAILHALEKEVTPPFCRFSIHYRYLNSFHTIDVFHEIAKGET